MYDPNALSTYIPSVKGPPQDIPSALAPCAPAPSAENLAMWTPVAQPQLQHAALLFLPKWATLGDFESVPQGYGGGNVMAEEAPISFSPFSLTDCTLLTHFSCNDFIAVAFPDLARDLNIQI